MATLKILPLLAVFLLLYLPSQANAEYIRLTPNLTAQIDEQAQRVTLAAELKNDGDESAFDVALELPTLNESHPVVQHLQSGESAKQEIAFTFERLRIAQRGSYIVPIRVLYKDRNYYPFSAVYPFTFALEPSPGRSVVATFSTGLDPLILAGEAAVTLNIYNTGSAPVLIQQITVVTPAEVLAAPHEIELPRQLESTGLLRHSVAFRSSGAIEGSEYFLGFVVSGTSGDKHFAEYFALRSEIKEHATNTRVIFIATVIGLALLFALLALARRTTRGK